MTPSLEITEISWKYLVIEIQFPHLYPDLLRFWENTARGIGTRYDTLGAVDLPPVVVPLSKLGLPV